MKSDEYYIIGHFDSSLSAKEMEEFGKKLETDSNFRVLYDKLKDPIDVLKEQYVRFWSQSPKKFMKEWSEIQNLVGLELDEKGVPISNKVSMSFSVIAKKIDYSKLLKKLEELLLPFSMKVAFSGVRGETPEEEKGEIRVKDINITPNILWNKFLNLSDFLEVELELHFRGGIGDELVLKAKESDKHSFVDAMNKYGEFSHVSIKGI